MKGMAIKANRTREHFVSREDADKVLDACPDAQWRLLFALSRYGGLRCPSEHQALTWDDVDWARNRMRITSPKTAHHEGGDERWIPMFPEVRRELEAVWEQTPKGTTHVISRYRDNRNLRTRFAKIITRAGLKPWPKLFQNLRSTRQTELAEEYPAHVVCAWLGNSEAVARRHYLQVTDAHFEKATGSAAQKTAQHIPVRAGKARHPGGDNAQITGRYDIVPPSANTLVGDEGLEPPTSTV
ncbi:MAG: tyrosine-type recombinase/integrase [Planctomycetia bacterium]|nr:tyrosine-type recombinase/integrase [Planctomycetia bacterium]